MEQYFYLEIIAGLSCAGYGISYLFMVKQIRIAAAKGNYEIDNFSILNIFKVYSLYLRIKRINREGPGFVFYLHFLFFAIALLLVYKLQKLGL
jgi:hypothetical protein